MKDIRFLRFLFPYARGRDRLYGSWRQFFLRSALTQFAVSFKGSVLFDNKEESKRAASSRLKLGVSSGRDGKGMLIVLKPYLTLSQ